jgi:hypothetical protein
MNYISHRRIPPSSINTAIKKFLEMGGTPPAADLVENAPFRTLTIPKYNALSAP